MALKAETTSINTLRKSLFKPRQRRLAVRMITDFSVLSTTSKKYFELTFQFYPQPQNSVLSNL
ncbi:Uncharacterised protein [Streptococcus pneumoniae]|nr:Uncharacterised protein [Streptococcus pneumoniae]